ncbi:MAG: hypothetical protein K1X92_01840 [Bacteroidia bacterium]|nr:hypothetical protein [Bacteroidia bacterium]
MFLKNSQNVRLLYGSQFLFLPPLTKEEGGKKMVLSSESILPEVPEIPAESEPVAEVSRPIAEKPAEMEIPPVVFPEKEPVKPKNVFSKGVSIDWKKRATARFFVIVPKVAFSNRMLMIVLREFIKENEIPLEWISFGVYPDGANDWETESMPLKAGLIFSDTLSFTESPEKTGENWIFPAPDLMSIVAKPTLQTALSAILKELKSLI